MQSNYNQLSTSSTILCPRPLRIRSVSYQTTFNSNNINNLNNSNNNNNNNNRSNRKLSITSNELSSPEYLDEFYSILSGGSTASNYNNVEIRASSRNKAGRHSRKRSSTGSFIPRSKSASNGNNYNYNPMRIKTPSSPPLIICKPLFSSIECLLFLSLTRCFSFPSTLTYSRFTSTKSSKPFS